MQAVHHKFEIKVTSLQIQFYVQLIYLFEQGNDRYYGEEEQLPYRIKHAHMNFTRTHVQKYVSLMHEIL